ncbi:hypothetical protein OG250_32050 [Streptomyces sp. NBC_00487]|uniref:hypothetical protein n=1 Tax=unclassified Streptomyces TaxID=2593676 RepID=UPI002E16F505|nr:MULTISPECIES: hypothetical protein [unclassified Streptomyces]
MNLPGFTRRPPPAAAGDRPIPQRFAREEEHPGDLVHLQEITCERVEGPLCHSRCEGLDQFDECYASCLADRCRDPAWWGGTP